MLLISNESQGKPRGEGKLVNSLSNDKWSQVIIPVGVTDSASRPKSFFYTRSYSLWLLCLYDTLSQHQSLGILSFNWTV